MENIAVTLQEFGGKSQHEVVSVSPKMHLHDFKNLAKDSCARWGWWDPNPAIGSVHIRPDIVLAVQDTRCELMHLELSDYNIIDGSVVTLVRVPNPAMVDAEEQLAQALASIEEAELVFGEGADSPALADLHPAKQMLLAHGAANAQGTWTHPLARGAANAEGHIRHAIQTAEDEDRDIVRKRALKRANRDTRDLVVHLCRAVCRCPADRDEFIEHLRAAYDGDLPGDLRAQLLLSYHKNQPSEPGGFKSSPRGGPRPRPRGGPQLRLNH